MICIAIIYTSLGLVVKEYQKKVNMIESCHGIGVLWNYEMGIEKLKKSTHYM